MSMTTRLVDSRKAISLPAPLNFTVQREHSKGAVIGDAQHCIASKACQEAYGYRMVEIYANTAYVEDNDGNVFKGQPNAALRRVVLGFDNLALFSLNKGIPVSIRPPRRHVSPEYLRSAEYKETKARVKGSGRKHSRPRQLSNPIHAITLSRYSERLRGER